MFRGFTNSVDEFAIGIDDVKIFTSNCEVYPVFSSPGKNMVKKCVIANCCSRCTCKYTTVQLSTQRVQLGACLNLITICSFSFSAVRSCSGLTGGLNANNFIG